MYSEGKREINIKYVILIGRSLREVDQSLTQDRRHHDACTKLQFYEEILRKLSHGLGMALEDFLNAVQCAVSWYSVRQ